MLRFLSFAAVWLFVAASASARELAPFGAGGGPEAKTPAPANPQKIIEELRSDFGRVGSDFEKNQTGAETRKTQQRIIEGIDKLLEQQDPNPSQSKSANSSKNPPKPKEASANPPPVTNAEQKPPVAQPKSTVLKPQQKPAITKDIAPASRAPKTLAEMRPEQTVGNQRWGDYPPRFRQEIDAFARERFMRNYAEILREYYRSLAESGRDQRQQNRP